jgi:xanthine dehydrogenase accessory factor
VTESLIVIKGAGEMASGIAHRLFMAHFTHICMLEIESPLCVRRTVSFCETIFQEEIEVEGVMAKLVRDPADLAAVWAHRQIGVIIDPAWKTVADLRPDVVVDAIMAKKNLGTRKDEAPFVIGVGPGFSAPDIVHAVVESNRGHDLGRIIYDGTAEPHTGMPGLTAGFSRERVLRSPHEGWVRHEKSFDDPVKKGEIVLYVDATPVRAGISGVVRGLVRDIWVRADEKVGDIEPRGGTHYSRTISDKARAIGGGVLEAVCHHLNRLEDHSRGENEGEAYRDCQVSCL